MLELTYIFDDRATTYAIRFRHRRFEPVFIYIILNSAPASVAVVHKIRRISKDEVYAVRWHPTHEFDAVAVKDGVSWKFRLD